MALTHTSSVAVSGKDRQTRGAWSGAGLLGLTFLLYTVAFPPFNLWPAIFLAPVPLALCTLGRPANWRWLLAYYAMGVVFFGVNLFWLLIVAPGGVIALALFCGLYFAFFAAAFRRLVIQLRWPAMLALPLVWVACEYVRSTLFSGFAWFLLGNAAVNVPEFIQIADLFGVWAVSFCIAMTAGLLVDILRLPLRKRQGKASFWSQLNPAVVRLSMCYLAVMIGVLGYGLFRIHEPGAHYPGITVSTVQEYIPQSVKDSTSTSQKQQLFQQHVDLSRAAAEQNPELIVWPETMVPEWINQSWLQANPDDYNSKGREYLAQARQYDQRLAELSSGTGAFLLVGAPGWDPLNDQRQNLAILYGPGRGQILPYYAKRHLVPFGEYIPFTDIKWIKNLLLKLTPYPDFDYSLTPGDAWITFVLPSRRPNEQGGQATACFGVPICYEDVMPYPCRSFVAPVKGKKGADFLVSISNDGWYDLWHNTAELDQHLQMTQMRAVENRVPIVRSVNAGNSGFVDSSGRVVRLVERNGVSHYVAGQATETLIFDRRVSLYSRIGDVFGVASGMICALAVAFTIVRPRLGKTKPDHQQEEKETE